MRSNEQRLFEREDVHAKYVGVCILMKLCCRTSSIITGNSQRNDVPSTTDKEVYISSQGK